MSLLCLSQQVPGGGDSAQAPLPRSACTAKSEYHKLGTIIASLFWRSETQVWQGVSFGYLSLAVDGGFVPHHLILSWTFVSTLCTRLGPKFNPYDDLFNE